MPQHDTTDTAHPDQRPRQRGFAVTNEPSVILTRTDRGVFVNLAAAASFEVTQLDERGRWGTVALFGAGDPTLGVDYVTVPGLDADSEQEAFAKFTAFARDVLHARVYQPAGT